jgi:hypothetical protein
MDFTTQSHLDEYDRFLLERKLRQAVMHQAHRISTETTGYTQAFALALKVEARVFLWAEPHRPRLVPQKVYRLCFDDEPLLGGSP